MVMEIYKKKIMVLNLFLIEPQLFLSFNQYRLLYEQNNSDICFLGNDPLIPKELHVTVTDIQYL